MNEKQITILKKLWEEDILPVLKRQLENPYEEEIDIDLSEMKFSEAIEYLSEETKWSKQDELYSYNYDYINDNDRTFLRDEIEGVLRKKSDELEPDFGGEEDYDRDELLDWLVDYANEEDCNYGYYSLSSKYKGLMSYQVPLGICLEADLVVQDIVLPMLDDEFDGLMRLSNVDPKDYIKHIESNLKKIDKDELDTEEKEKIVEYKKELLKYKQYIKKDFKYDYPIFKEPSISFASMDELFIASNDNSYKEELHLYGSFGSDVIDEHVNYQDILFMKKMEHSITHKGIIGVPNTDVSISFSMDVPMDSLRAMDYPDDFDEATRVKIKDIKSLMVKPDDKIYINVLGVPYETYNINDDKVRQNIGSDTFFINMLKNGEYENLISLYKKHNIKYDFNANVVARLPYGFFSTDSNVYIVKKLIDADIIPKDFNDPQLGGLLHLVKNKELCKFLLDIECPEDLVDKDNKTWLAKHPEYLELKSTHEKKVLSKEIAVVEEDKPRKKMRI